MRRRPVGGLPLDHGPGAHLRVGSDRRGQLDLGRGHLDHGEVRSTSGEVTSTSASTGTLYDLGTGADLDPLQPPGCKDKIDFLSVMQRGFQYPAIQQKLIAAFPAFIDTIQDKFAGFDVHISAGDAHPWPGNVRELAHTLERVVLLGRRETVELDDLPRNFRRGPGLSPVFDAIVPMRGMQRRYAAWVLEQSEGVRARAARGLGIDVKTLARLLDPDGSLD